MKKIEFWIKASNYSTAVMVIALIAERFFRKYLVTVIVPIMILGVVAFIVFAISELMKFIIKRKQ